MKANRGSELSLGEHVCVALAYSGLTHGWAIGSELAPDGSLGNIWRLSRALTYRALEQAEQKGLVRRARTDTARPRARAPITLTAKGRRETVKWLDTPVAHVRDLRTELLLKLALRGRVGLDNQDFLRRQRDTLAPVLDRLSRAHVEDDDLVMLWRREQARATRRYLDHAITALSTTLPMPHRSQADLRISARNQIPAVITAVQHGEVMSTVHTRLADGHTVTAAITRDAAEDLELTAGDDIVVIIKATEVLIGKQ